MVRVRVGDGLERAGRPVYMHSRHVELVCMTGQIQTVGNFNRTAYTVGRPHYKYISRITPHHNRRS